LKSNKSIVRELKPKGLFIDRLKEYEKVEEMHFWSGAIYYALIENRNMNEMYYRNKLTDTFIDNDTINEYYIAEFQYPEREKTPIEKEDIGDLKDFLSDKDDEQCEEISNVYEVADELDDFFADYK